MQEVEGEENENEEDWKITGVKTYLKAPQGLSMSFPQYRWMKVQCLENLMERERL